MSEPWRLEARGLVKGYDGVEGRIEVLRGLDLSLGGGEALAVVGDSGVGKSTLLHVVGGLDRPDAGSLTLAGQDVLAGGDAGRRRFRNAEVGFVFQFHHLLPEFSALENVEMPLRVAGVRDGRRERAAELLTRLGMRDRLGHTPGALSGGEQQRVAIARALVGDPRLVLADEPTGNLDPATGDAVFGLLGELQAERGFALIVATHSARLARACPRVARLVEGRLVRLAGDTLDAYFGDLGAKPDGEPML